MTQVHAHRAAGKPDQRGDDRAKSTEQSHLRAKTVYERLFGEVIPQHPEELRMHPGGEFVVQGEDSSELWIRSRVPLNVEESVENYQLQHRGKEGGINYERTESAAIEYAAGLLPSSSTWKPPKRGSEH